MMRLSWRCPTAPNTAKRDCTPKSCHATHTHSSACNDGGWGNQLGAARDAPTICHANQHIPVCDWGRPYAYTSPMPTPTTQPDRINLRLGAPCRTHLRVHKPHAHTDGAARSHQPHARFIYCRGGSRTALTDATHVGHM